MSDWEESVVVAVDFDNTLTNGSTIESTGEINRYAVGWVKKFQKMGCVIVLWTTRDGDNLKEAVDLLKSNGLSVDYANAYPPRGNRRKIDADMFIDDKANDGSIRWWRTYMKARRLVREKGRLRTRRGMEK